VRTTRASGDLELLRIVITAGDWSSGMAGT